MKKTLLRSAMASGVAVLVATAWSPVVSSTVSAQVQTSPPNRPAPTPAQAAPAPAATAKTYQVNLSQLNKSAASGTGTVTVNGNNVTVSLRSTGLSPNLAHAQHIHVGGQAICPTPAADADKDGFVSSREAEPLVGGVRIALTTTGDVAPGSALAVDRFPKADARGNLTYNRTFALPSGITAADMTRATIDQHGIASLFNNKTAYDGDKKSELNSQLPFETTAIATCGKLTSTPVGAPNTGFGSTAGIESPAILVFGAVALAGAAALALYARRPLHSNR